MNQQLTALQPEAVVVPGREPMWLWPGLLVIGRNKHGTIANGCFYEVLAANDQTVEIQTEAGPVQVSHAVASKNLRLTYALTYASVQGLTLPGRVRLWDVASRHFTRTHLFVALSRATAASLVDIV